MMKRRTFLLLGIALAAGIGSAAAATPPTLRVLSYNIQHGLGMNRKLDLARTAAVIRRLKPDLVAIQEVDKKTRRVKGVDEAAELGRLTGLHAAFGRAMDYGGGEYGVAVLSRFPMTGVHTYPLPHAGRAEPRAALAVRVRPEGFSGDVLFLATHLENADAEVRAAQAREINKAALPQDAAPAILAGDLNDVPEGEARAVLLRQWTDVTRAPFAPTWPAEKPNRKIDYILYRPADAWRVVEQRVIDEPAASDHRPIFAVLEMAAAKTSDHR